MNAAIGTKRLAIAAAPLIAAAFVALIGFAAFLPAASVRDAVKAEIRAVTGLDPVLGDDVSLSLFPSGSVRFHNVRLANEAAGDPVVTADELIARLRYFPLLAGHIEIADVTLVRPFIKVAFSAAGESNWSGLISSLARALEPHSDRTASFSEIGIQNGTVIVYDGGSDATERLEGVDFQVAWPSISRSFGANGHFSWHNEKVEASLTLSDFLAALTGERSGLKVRLTSVPLTLAFDGAASDEPTLKIQGTLGVEASSLREALRWIGNDKLPFGGFGRFALRAQSDIGGRVAALSNVNVELDGNSAEGALTISADPHRLVQGTLAADALDLTPYVSGIRLQARNERNWNQLPITLDGLNDLSLDLRLSAANIRISSARLGRTAVAATMRDGKINITVGESQAFGGLAKGNLGLANAAGGVAVTSHMQFADVDLDNCLGQVFGLHRIEGRGTLTVNLDGTGDSVLAVTHALNGTASLNAGSGALTGINIEQLLRRLERRPLSGSGDFRSGRTPFDQLAINLKVNQGVVSIDDMRIVGPSVRLAVSGQASLPTRDLDLKGVATLVSSTTTDEFVLPFVVQGPWDDPLMLPDAQSLIRRSGAAAPLLGAGRPYNAGDAVRSVIDQLMAAPPTSAASPSVSPAAAPAAPNSSQ
ncbi:MAG TPA: AsmA family protein [Xanthobacteraceae bacterium]|nr:AsmA family protein [Xanthobacteraceae bacterium]